MFLLSRGYHGLSLCSFCLTDRFLKAAVYSFLLIFTEGPFMPLRVSGQLCAGFYAPLLFLWFLLFLLGNGQCTFQFHKLYSGSCNGFVSLFVRMILTVQKRGTQRC